jgi:hypothetical protein
MDQSAPKCVPFAEYFDALSDDEQCHVLDWLREQAQELGVTVQYRRLRIVEQKPLIAHDALDSLTRLKAQITLN